MFLDRAFASEGVEGMEDQADLRVVGAAHGVPSLAVVVDMAAPAAREQRVGGEADMGARAVGGRARHLDHALANQLRLSDDPAAKSRRTMPAAIGVIVLVKSANSIMLQQ